MGAVTITGAMIIIIGWLTLVEFDSYPEAERKKILQTIKESPIYVLIIILMPIGIVFNLLGGFIDSILLMIVGSSLIIIQGLAISIIFWKNRRWKSIFLFIIIIILGSVIYIPLIRIL